MLFRGSKRRIGLGWGMSYHSHAISGDLRSLPKLPAWVTSGRTETLETVAFRSGAALTVLEALVSEPAHGVPLSRRP